MLIICRSDLEESDFQRLAEKLSSLPYPLLWGRRSGRLVIQLEHARGDQPELGPVVEDPAVEHILRDPSEREIARIFTRRELLNLSVASTGLIAGAAILGPMAVYLAAPATQRPARQDTFVAKVDAFRVNTARRKVIEGREYIIVRRDETQYHALASACTHSLVCLVEWDAKRRQLVCPCHRGIFDLNGNVVSGPPPRPLEHLDVLIRDGAVYVRRP
ncbi:MAG: QcrA and Rieske domain-containing protein [Planctomycetota bacterium]|jgi:Rieske Fe-S protein